MTRTQRSALGLAVLAVAAGVVICVVTGACAAPKPELRQVTLGEVQSPTDEKGPAADMLGGTPASFLVGGNADVDVLMAERKRLHGIYPAAKLGVVIDGSGLDALKSTALGDRLVEAMLDEGATLLVDRTGATARSLRDGAMGVHLVHVNAESRVDASAKLPGASADVERAAMGLVP